MGDPSTPDLDREVSGDVLRKTLPSVPPNASHGFYDSVSGKLDLKKIAVWVGAIAAFLVAAGTVGTKAEEFVVWWLELDSLEERLVACESQAEVNRADLHPVPMPRDANERLSQVIPRIAQALQDGQKERRRHNDAITRLSTIHEFSLTRVRGREVARAAMRAVRDDDGVESTDSVAALTGL